jgi:ankyrin repeat protein
MQAIEMYKRHERAESGDLERVKQLVQGGANIEETNEDDMTTLLLASQEGHFDIVVYLVEHGANVAHTDSEGTTALHWACANMNLPTVKCLLELVQV